MALKKLKMGTRGSPLAMAQSLEFAQSLQNKHPGLEIESVVITTSGDRIQDRFLNEEGGKGLFVREIEEALLKREIDFAVHSLKDLPADLPPDLSLPCLPKRLHYEDVLITQNGTKLADLPQGAKIGTVSLRRRIQLARRRPDFKFELLRGNIDTRIRKLGEGEFDGIVLALAGIQRLGVTGLAMEILPIVPAPGQGCLAIEIHRENHELSKMLEVLHDLDTQTAVVAERRVMKGLGGDCNLPMGALGQVAGDVLQLSACIASPDGEDWLEDRISGFPEEPIQLADELLDRFMERGAKSILEKIQKARHSVPR